MKVREKNFVEIARADARFDCSEGRTAAAIEEKLLFTRLCRKDSST